MKTFVLIALGALPATLSAQALSSPASTLSVPAPATHPRAEAEAASWSFSAERASELPATDFRMRVIRPNRADVPRMRIAQPDDRYDYKMLQVTSENARQPTEAPRSPRPRSSR